MFHFQPLANKNYIAFNKPYAVLCQFTQPSGSEKKTLAEFAFPKNVYSTGRLDFDSEGLLILSDDGRLNKVLLDPKVKQPKTYLVCVENIPSPEQLDKLRKGVLIEGKKTLPAQANLLPDEPMLPPRPVPIRERKNIPTAWIELTIIEGRNRQVRKMTAAVGCPTLRLVRIKIGDLALANLNLAPGEWRALEPEEVLTLCSNHAGK
jgi:23S rRNA pseudouridine2457 synthase